jgi:hypothetical protein
MANEITTNIMDTIKGLNLNTDESPNIDQGERGVSIAAGSYLLYKGVKNLYRHPLLGLLGTAAGGFLLLRGATGVCPLYKKLGRDTTDPEAINITERITVNAPKASVYNFWRDLSNLPKFMTHLKSVEEHGSQSHWVANTPGQVVALSWKCGDHPGRGGQLYRLAVGRGLDGRQCRSRSVHGYFEWNRYGNTGGHQLFPTGRKCGTWSRNLVQWFVRKDDP